MELKVAVIAGTPVDTRMGVEYILSKNEELMQLAANEGIAETEGVNDKVSSGSAGDMAVICAPVYMPAAEDCDAQIKFQYSSYENKCRRIDELFDSAIGQGIQDFFIYCNSLSGAFDFDQYAIQKSEETGLEIRVYTPLQVYRRMGREYKRVGVMAANNLSAYNIERELMSSNEDVYMIGTGNMAIVSAIESGMAPSDIIDQLGLRDMIGYMEASGSEILVLGCTHFPYIKEELAKYCSIPIIDPAEEMYRAMTSR